MKLPSNGFKNKWKYLFTQWGTGKCVVTGYCRRQKHNRVWKVISKNDGKKCLLDVVGFIQLPTSYKKNWILKMQQGEILSCVRSVSHTLALSLQRWSGQMLVRSYPDSPSALTNTRLAQSPHIPVGSFLTSHLPPAPATEIACQFIQQQPGLLFWSVVLSAKSSYPLIGCLWQCGHWQGSTILNFRQGDNNLARLLRAGSAPWPFFSLRI